MKSKQEYVGNDVAQAIQAACEALHVSQDQLNIDVIATGSAGIFGFGRKKAKIAVSLKNDRARSVSSPEKADSDHGRREARNSGDDRKKRTQTRRPKRMPEKPPATIPPAALEKVRSDLTKILELMGFPSQVTVTNEENKIRAHVTGDYTEDIIGPEGQTLDGLQYLLRKIISRDIDGKVMFTLDAGEYRENRKQELEETALQLAGEVKETGKTMSIPALNPAERRIVHMTLQDDTEIRSRSVGEGHFKKILIYLPGKGKKRPESSRRR